MIKYYVRTTGQREFNYNLDYEKIIDKNHNAMESFIKCLYLMNDSDSVLLEDDLVLCKNFKQEIEKVISIYPDKIINFFTKPDLYFTTHLSTLFSYNQCTYYPKGMTKVIAENFERLNIHKSRFYGVLLNDVLRELKIPHVVYRPSLVQHIDGKSVLCDGKIFKRNTIYFKDYLDELGIDINEAYSKENFKKLTERLEEDRKIWYKDLEKGE